MWRIYKEGQGKWGRGLLACAVLLGTLFAVSSLHGYLPQRERWTIPVLNWSFDYRFLFEAPILILAGILGVWLYNRPPTADFLIETEHELRHKVAWPSRGEVVNGSTVVVVTVLLLGVLVFAVDVALTWIVQSLFGPPSSAGPPF